MKKIEKSWQNNGERGKNRTRRIKLVLELLIGTKLMAVYIQTGQFTQIVHFYLYIQKHGIHQKIE